MEAGQPGEKSLAICQRNASKMTEVLALIPARGGSKSIPRKNIRSFAGHPLIAYSIAAGLAAESVTRLIVSTDDEEIAAIARDMAPKRRSCARPSCRKITPPTCRFSSMLCSGWRKMKATGPRSWCNCAPPHRCDASGISTNRFTSCWRTPRRTRSAPSASRSKIRSRCGRSIRTAL